MRRTAAAPHPNPLRASFARLDPARAGRGSAPTGLRELRAGIEPRVCAMPSFNSVAVIGAGAWGTALAGVAARAGRDVVLYARQPERAAEIAATRANPK